MEAEARTPRTSSLRSELDKVVTVISGISLVTIAVLSTTLLSFPPENDYISLEFSFLKHFTANDYLSVGVILFGLFQLCLVILYLLCWNSQETKRAVHFCCLAAAVISLGILVLFAVRPPISQLEEKIISPVANSYTAALEDYTSQGSDQVVMRMKALQVDQFCCLFPEEDNSCLVVNSGTGKLSKNNGSCFTFFYTFYTDWFNYCQKVIQACATAFCGVLASVIVILMIKMCTSNKRNYTVNAQKLGENKRINLSCVSQIPVPYSYTPFQNDKVCEIDEQGPYVKNRIFPSSPIDDKPNPSLCVTPIY